MLAAPASESPKKSDLAFTHQLADRAGDVLDRHGRIDAVLVEEVDIDRCRAGEAKLQPRHEYARAGSPSMPTRLPSRIG